MRNTATATLVVLLAGAAHAQTWLTDPAFGAQRNAYGPGVQMDATGGAYRGTPSRPREPRARSLRARAAQNVPSSVPTGLQPSGRTPSLLSALNTPRLRTSDRHTATRTPKVASR